MALSNAERRRLREIEEDLMSEDPDLARHLEAAPVGRSPASRVYGLLVVVAGLVLVITGITTGLTFLALPVSFWPARAPTSPCRVPAGASRNRNSAQTRRKR